MGYIVTWYTLADRLTLLALRVSCDLDLLCCAEVCLSRAGRITHAVIRTGNLDEEGLSSPYTTIPNTKINDEDAAQLALEAAQQYASI